MQSVSGIPMVGTIGNKGLKTHRYRRQTSVCLSFLTFYHKPMLMNASHKKYGKFSAEELRMLISFLPLLETQHQEILKTLESKKHLVFNDRTVNWYWFEFYELPYLEHLAHVLIALGLGERLKEVINSPNPVQALFDDMNNVNNDTEDDDEDVSGDQLNVAIPYMLGLLYSLSCSLRCLMIYGFYLNDLVEFAKNNLNNEKGDKSILQAIRIDKTVLGSKTVMARISRAVLTNDQNFLKKLNSAMKGKLGKRDTATYQKMRFVLQVLHESDAPKLSDQELKELFVKELNLISDSQQTAEKNAGEFARNFKKI